MNISRTELKSELGLAKVADITNVRKALGQPNWQNSQVDEIDATEIRHYYSLVRDEKLSPDDAILQIASSRNGRSAYCNEIDPDAIAKPSDAKRDETEDKGAAIQALIEATQQGNIGLAETGSQMAKTNVQALKVGYVTTLVTELSDFGNNLRSNLNSLSEAAAATPLDLREAKLPTPKLAVPVTSSALEPYKTTQRQQSAGLW
ncbi:MULTISPECIES: hypothetical protein [Kamptonema]|uniref:hypothetical protein n=1 Tax=Kamptonema TaxID=1501433 RepID=UPI0001DAC7F5|nr:MULTISPECIES: hypothetical protein [Kamptonema]CBN54947.1 hypothetical protein OSCI_1340006 [Kamptonema sp. PCC 6506]